MRNIELAVIGASVAAAPPGPELANRLVERVSIDSRTVRPGDLFWALPGEWYDGHDFVARALAAGAVAAVVNAEHAATGPLLRVRDSRRALGDFAAWYRGLHAATVIGVTGSVGKTSTREAIFAVLSRHHSGLRSERNLNNDIGVPLTLLELATEHKFAVVEMGASREGEIARLAVIARPQIGVLTAVAEAHLEGFGSLDGVERGKGELVASLGTTGTAVLNGDDPRVRAIGERAACPVVWFGVASSPGAPHTSAHGIEIDDGTVSFRLDNGMPIRLNAAGRHQVHAALAAVAVGRLLGMADEEIRAGLETYRSAPMRSQVERYDGLTLINDAYNASPASMRAAIELLGEWRRPGRRTLVCGDMKELGRDEQRLHGELGEQIARCRGIDRCVAVGPLAECLVAAARRAGMNDASLVHCDSAEQAADLLAATLEQNEIVLVKGSRAMRLELVVERLRARFGIPSAAA